MFLNTLIQIVGRGSIILINQFFVLISIPILAARLDFEVFGQIAIGFVLVMLSWVISDWGIQNYSIEIWKKFKSTKERIRFISSAVFLNFLISLFLLIILLFLILFKILDFPVLFWVAIIPSILMGSIYPLWFYQVEKNPHDMILPTLLARIIFLLIIFYLVQDNNTAYWAFLAQGVNMSMITFYSFYRMIRVYKVRFALVGFKEILNIGLRSKPYLLNALANNQINTVWSFGLSMFGGPAAMAIFNIGDQIYRAGGAITGIIAQSIRIQFINKRFSQLKFTFYFFVLLYVLVVLGIIYSGEFVIVHFFSSDYLPAIPILKIMIIAWGVHGIAKLLNYPVLGESHGAEWVNRSTYIILLFHAFAFLIWVIFYSSAFEMAIFFLMVIILQMIFFLFHIFRRIR